MAKAGSGRVCHERAPPTLTLSSRPLSRRNVGAGQGEGATPISWHSRLFLCYNPPTPPPAEAVMPLSPTPAQSEASRANGALSRGPATDAGKARSTANAPAPSHGLRGTGPFALLPGEDPAAFDDLLADLLATYAPADAAERHWVEEVAHTMWRRRRLHALEARVLANLLSDEEGGPPPRLPSLATLARYLGRLERDLRLAHAELARLREDRLATPEPELTDLPPTRSVRATGTPEPEPQARAQPKRPALNRAHRRRLAALARARPAA